MGRVIEFRVFDLYKGEVLYGDDIPILAKGLQESIRQFSGQTYELSQYIEQRDREGVKIYDQDILDIFAIELDVSKNINYRKITTGLVQYYSGEPCILYRDKSDDVQTMMINDRDHAIKVIGNRMENKELLPFHIPGYN